MSVTRKPGSILDSLGTFEQHTGLGSYPSNPDEVDQKWVPGLGHFKSASGDGGAQPRLRTPIKS